MLDLEEQMKIIKKGVAEIISEDELRERLKKSIEDGRPLKIKFGMDPTAPDIHLGHTVILRKLRQFQDLGHEVTLLIGDFTSLVGDPTGRSETRKPMTREKIMENARTYQEQAFKILDPNKTIIRFNSEWLSKLTFEEVLVLSSKYTVARMLERDDFEKRFKSNIPIYIHEFMYPLMQGYDSVALGCDIEFGGTDQKFNILMGRMLQREYGKENGQIAILMPILEGIDGTKKMSKSLGNYIGIDEDPNDIYGKIMSIPDELIIRYYNLVTDVHPDKIEEIKSKMDDGSLNPRDAKMALAREIVSLYYGREKALEAEENFKTIFQRNEIPEDIEEIMVDSEIFNDGKVWLPKLLTVVGLTPTNNEAKRMIEQGAVRLNGERITSIEEDIKVNNGDVIQVGKRRFARLIVK
ncbi:tyrosine--tRNA ligase [Calorimonas adulescens]|jgi:tyrosyl-tRNA synthetase (EC 6.1.1.1)|uniref:Tyrosine--tRNA ligase n=1 Tax=Calorimonas adulescens TaxID=2606906 RepID=A0A5D8QC59_9THEO|nr:tyrosine--tRNA ligase [Calorimonas adulescens]